MNRFALLGGIVVVSAAVVVRTSVRAQRSPSASAATTAGLRAGDEIVDRPGMSAADDAAAVPTVVAKARMLATIGSGNDIEVRRGGHLDYLMPDRPPGLIP